MRKIFLFLAALIGSACYAADMNVTPETFGAAYDAAQDGDVLVLSEGTYSTQITPQSGKWITVKAADGVTPVLTCNVRCSDVNVTDCGLTFEGCDINHNTGDNYFINFDNIGHVKGLVFRNCTIENVGRCFIRTNNEGYYIDSIAFSNCIMKNNGANGWNFMYPKHAVGKLSVKNSTFYNYTSGESFFCTNAINTNNVMTFDCENNTFYNWGKDSNRSILNISTKYSNSSIFIIRNNIFAEADGLPAPNIVVATGGNLTAEKNLLVNVGTYSVKNAAMSNINDVTLESLGMASIGFPDPDNGDFSVLSSSPLAKAGTGGGCIGDPRWIKSLTDGVHVSTTVSPAEGGKTTPTATDVEKGSAVTLLATANYGYKFKEWQDVNGNTVSTSNPASIVVTADASYTAVFNKLQLFTLTVNKDGDGAKWGNISLSPVYDSNQYIDGTKVSATVTTNPVTSFLKWEDGTTDATRTMIMDQDRNITATFDVIPFIVGWDFSSSSRSDAPGDYCYMTDNTGTMNLCEADGTKTSWGTSTKSFGGTSLTCARRYTDATKLKNAPRSFVAQFSGVGYTNIQIKSKVGVDNECVLATQKLQYSIDGINYIDLASFDMTGQVNTDWMDFDAQLPSLSDEQKKNIYIRWFPDTTSSVLDSNPSGTEGFYLANVFIYADCVPVKDTIPPVLLSTAPAADSNNAGASGNIILYFNEKVKAGVGSVVLNGETLSAVYGSKTALFAYKGLKYGTGYDFVLPSGAITDVSGNIFSGLTLHFTTMERPQPTARKFDVIVAADGTGDVKTVQEAIDKCPANNATPWLVFIKNGTYTELIRIPSTKPYIHLIGQDKMKTVITYKVHAAADGNDTKFSSTTLGVDGDDVTRINASDFYAENISFENAWGVDTQSGPMALAVRNTADRAAFYNCRFRSYQDTWYTDEDAVNNRTYANNCWIEGAVDYFYGDGNAYIENSKFYNKRSGAVVTAPCHKTGTLWGYVFQNDTIDGTADANDGTQKLGRPWNNSPIAVYLNTTMNISVCSEGWTDMGVVPKLFAEYNSMDADGNVLDISHRKTSYLDRNTNTYGFCQAVLSSEEAAPYTYENVVCESDGWNPRKFFEQVAVPENATFNTTSVSWKPSQYAICYLVFKGDNMIAQTTDTNYAVANNNDDVITIKAVNEYGDLSEPATALLTTGINRKSTGMKTLRGVYDVDGRRLNSIRHGVNIVVYDTTDGKTVSEKMINK